MALAPAGLPPTPSAVSPVGFGRLAARRVPRADGASDHGRHDISVAVVGAGPVGLLAALALARRGYRKVRVLDRLPEPPGPEEQVWGDPDRSYNLGRGQRALMRFGAMDVVERFSRTVVGRKDWSNEGEPKELREKYPEVEVQFSTECTAVDFHHDTTKLHLQRCGPPAATEGLAQEESCISSSNGK